jgi:hypothetical protein
LPPSVTIDLQTQLVGSVVVVSPFAGNTAKQWFASTLARLEAAGVHIAAFELGNELNTPRFNAVRKDVAQVNLRHLRSRWFHPYCRSISSTVSTVFLRETEIRSRIKILRNSPVL